MTAISRFSPRLMRGVLASALGLALFLAGTADARENSQQPTKEKTAQLNKKAAEKKKTAKNGKSRKKDNIASGKRLKDKKVASKSKSRKGKAVAKNKRERKASAAQLAASKAARKAELAQAARRQMSGSVVKSTDAVEDLHLESNAAMVMNAETGELLYGKNADRTMPIASITKLMTAMVVLDAHLSLDERVTITEADVDRLRNTSSRLAVGTTVTRGELMLLALMASENRAAAALARTYPGGTSAAVRAMNNKAANLGMTHTRFLDSTGLHTENRASPNDLAIMVKTAHGYPEIRRYSTMSEYELTTNGHRTLGYRNTNPLVKNSDWDIGVTKTGFINESGKCLVMHAKIAATPVIIILMDSWGKYTRIGDANRVKKWMESAFRFRGLKLSHNNS